MAFVPNSSLFSKKQCSQISERSETSISCIWLCLLFENASTLTQIPILGQPPRRLSDNAYKALFASMCKIRSSILFEYPHSLSYQLITFTVLPITLVDKPSTIDERPSP